MQLHFGLPIARKFGLEVVGLSAGWLTQNDLSELCRRASQEVDVTEGDWSRDLRVCSLSLHLS
jgi:hypothetical protein